MNKLSSCISKFFKLKSILLTILCIFTLGSVSANVWLTMGSREKSLVIEQYKEQLIKDSQYYMAQACAKMTTAQKMNDTLARTQLFPQISLYLLSAADRINHFNIYFCYQSDAVEHSEENYYAQNLFNAYSNTLSEWSEAIQGNLTKKIPSEDSIMLVQKELNHINNKLNDVYASRFNYETFTETIKELIKEMSVEEVKAKLDPMYI